MIIAKKIIRSKSIEFNNTELPLILVKNSPFNKYIPINNVTEHNKILKKFPIKRPSNFIWFLKDKKK